ncbi:hypothetical protein [Streptomyces sp. NPDC056683]|uniref:hypothetical protein n=1 Tax=Streptomyces sp. NPDC056683 TaxID=3345910 RepID=UPI0036C47F38
MPFPSYRPRRSTGVRRAHERAGSLAGRGGWYGRGTGVGGHRSVTVGPSDAAGGVAVLGSVCPDGSAVTACAVAVVLTALCWATSRRM